MDESRKQFERFWEVNNHSGNPPIYGWGYWRKGDGYKVEEDDYKMDDMWIAWQASRAAIEIELPESFTMHSGRTAYLYVSEVQSAIRAAGIKVIKVKE